MRRRTTVALITGGTVADMLDLRSDDELLDIGRRPGGFVAARAQRVGRVVGLDASPLMLRAAHWRLADRIAAGTAELVLGNAAMPATVDLPSPTGVVLSVPTLDRGGRRHVPGGTGDHGPPRCAAFCDDGGVSRRTSIVICVALIAVATLVGLALFPQLPDPMPSHWDAAGNVDGYMSRTWGVLLMPLITAGLAALLFAIPSMDPLRANIETFHGAYHAFVVGFVAFMVYVYALTLAAGMGRQFNMTQLLVPAMGVLFIGVGRLLRTARRNYFIGIRTPWTLASDQVWDATHALGARTFTVGGIVAIVAGFLGDAGFWLMMAVLIGAALVPVVYSYVLWRRLGRPAPTP